jgi:hypothetical protein
MPDSFDIQRKMDHAADNDADQAVENLKAVRDQAGERLERLVQLDANHYFDPQNKQVLFKMGQQFRNLGHDPAYLAQAAEKIEEQARQHGYTPIQGGLFWDQGMKQLYVKNGDKYVLYALDRRKETP